MFFGVFKVDTPNLSVAYHVNRPQRRVVRKYSLQLLSNPKNKSAKGK